MKRVITALFLVPFAVYTVLFAPPLVFTGIVALVSALCFIEYAQITGSHLALGLVAGLLFLLAPPPLAFLLAILATLAAMCLPLSSNDPGAAVKKSAALVLGVLYIFGAWKTATLLRGFNAGGRHWLMFALMVNWIGDTGAYYVGRRWGRRKLAPAISPGKTWEGAFASLATGMLFGMIYLPLAIPGLNIAIAGLFALVANAAGQVGDLAESAIKRSANVKDSGTLLPGHGGVLDRVDSTIFTLPVVYALLAAFQR